MLTDSLQSSIGAGVTTNVFLGRPIEFIGVTSVARLLAVADAAGVNFQWLINVGGVQLAPIAAGSTANVASVTGAGPKDDEDTVASGVSIPAGGRSQLNVTNSGGSTTNFRYRAIILP
jgi:hypothetical protein